MSQFDVNAQDAARYAPASCGFGILKDVLFLWQGSSIIQAITLERLRKSSKIKLNIESFSTFLDIYYLYFDNLRSWN